MMSASGWWNRNVKFIEWPDKILLDLMTNQDNVEENIFPSNDVYLKI